MKYLITYGVGGGFNDIRNKIIECENQEKAESEAYEAACEVFDEYDLEGYGIDPDADLDEINDERESWLDYSVELYDEDEHGY